MTTHACTGLLGTKQVRAPPEVTLYLSSTSDLVKCLINFGPLHSFFLKSIREFDAELGDLYEI